MGLILSPLQTWSQKAWPLSAGAGFTHSNTMSLKKLLCGTLVSLPHEGYKNTYIFFSHCIQLKNFNRWRFLTSYLRNLQTTGNENLTKCRWHSQPTLKACWAPLSPWWPLAKRECSNETPSTLIKWLHPTGFSPLLITVLQSWGPDSTSWEQPKR